MLIGRRPACETVDSLLEGAQRGASDVVVVRGEPGIGKTTLLTYARDQADGMRVLSTAGVPAESALAFGGLLDLLRPLRDLLDDLPAPQREALAGAMALGPPANTDRFTVYAGVLSLHGGARLSARYREPDRRSCRVRPQPGVGAGR